DKLLLMTTQGKGIRMKVKDIRLVGRIAQGVKLIDLAAGDQVRSIARIVQGADDGDIDEIEEEGDEE
ncbi:MAG: DNA gyrase C-terminal beta-propeller domain-containing protein, partial [Fimbriimonadaceae bacterium]